MTNARRDTPALDIEAICARLDAMPSNLTWEIVDRVRLASYLGVPYEVADFLIHAETDMRAVVAEVKRLRTKIENVSVTYSHRVDGWIAIFPEDK